MALCFHWDENNRNHIAKHGVTTEEAEQVVNNNPFDITVNLRNGEERTVQLGSTDAGRVLLVITTWREQKVRVITAYPAARKLREVYSQKREQSDVGGSQDSGLQE
jgi:uncharacterized DUF497 family protein